ncbi:response regulator transcription factor [Pseudomonas hamedanensis]|uniref:Response regulator transcription factor n=1 Tax=Pseudomonas hamedanensis TaxID=2745504 RepID=A0A9E6P2N0_9PSED|nr:response regulator transcription factor [Pseudomonas hamedanensis]QXI18854.1 response regulator transcription factor [Pseudomonas hamedanensis]
MLNTIRVGVLDEQEVVRYGLCNHLASQSGMIVVGSYRSAGHALQAADQGELDLLLMDHRLNHSDSIGLIKTLNKDYPALKVLVLMAQPNTAVASLLLTAGGHGVVSKTQPLGVYVEAVRAVAAGESYCCTGSMADASQCQSVSGAGAQADHPGTQLLGHPMLSLREREVLRLCISGMTVTQIAIMFERSVKTVSAQKLTAYRKLGLKNDMELFKRLSRRGT